MSRLRIAVIGVGHLGRFHAQKIDKNPDAELAFVSDVNLERLQAMAKEFPSARTNQNFAELVGQVDGVIIATPTQNHFEPAKFFLANGVHVLIEKPITETVAQAEMLCKIARQNNLILQVGHVERFNAALISARKKLKQPLFIECIRIAPFKPRALDVDVILDLMIHDLDVIMSLVDSEIVAISAVGTPVLTKHVDIANVRMEFASKAVANITASRVSQKTERKFRVFQKEQYLSIDFGTSELNLTTKTGAWHNFEDELPLTFETWELDKGDALYAEDEAFIRAIINKTPALVSGEDGLLALRVAEQIREDIGKRLQ